MLAWRFWRADADYQNRGGRHLESHAGITLAGAFLFVLFVGVAEYYILRDRTPFQGRAAWRRAVGRLGGRLADYRGGMGG